MRRRSHAAAQRSAKGGEEKAWRTRTRPPFPGQAHCTASSVSDRASLDRPSPCRAPPGASASRRRAREAATATLTPERGSAPAARLQNGPSRRQKAAAGGAAERGRRDGGARCRTGSERLRRRTSKRAQAPAGLPYGAHQPCAGCGARKGDLRAQTSSSNSASARARTRAWAPAGGRRRRSRAERGGPSDGSSC